MSPGHDGPAATAATTAPPPLDKPPPGGRSAIGGTGAGNPAWPTTSCDSGSAVSGLIAQSANISAQFSAPRIRRRFTPRARYESIADRA